MLPALKKAGVEFKTIASHGGVNGVYLGKKFGFEEATTETKYIFEDSNIDAVFITTRHNTHARFVMEGLRAGRHVFVEKPLCLTPEELEEIKGVYRESTGILMVGFNRRFAPHLKEMKKLLDTIREPKSFIVTVNAGYLPADHWTQDPVVGGGRIIGEACHFIDLLRYLVGQSVVNFQATRMGNNEGVANTEDKVAITLSFADGSFGTIHYLANGHKSFPKERVEVFCGGRILVLDNYRRLYGYGWPGLRIMRLWRQDKGHASGVKAFIDSVRKGGPSPIPFEEIEEVTRVTLGLNNLVKGFN
jgi:predicted dehydrogenase